MLIELNQEIMEGLSKTEREIVVFINENEKRLAELSIVDIAFDTYTSPSTVSRAIRKCGINGFNELRYRLTEKGADKDIQNMGEILNKSLIEAQRVLEQISLASVLEFISVIKGASRVFVLARGLTEYVAQEFTLKLQLLDFNAVFFSDPNIMRKKSETMRADEALVIFSLNGGTRELIESAQNANHRKAKVVTCCCNENSELIQVSNVNLIGFKHRHDAITEYEVASRVSLHMMARIIIDYLVEEQGKTVFRT